jgi:hypothetical protein
MTAGGRRALTPSARDDGGPQAGAQNVPLTAAPIGVTPNDR